MDEYKFQLIVEIQHNEDERKAIIHVHDVGEEGVIRLENRKELCRDVPCRCGRNIIGFAPYAPADGPSIYDLRVAHSDINELRKQLAKIHGSGVFMMPKEGDLAPEVIRPLQVCPSCIATLYGQGK